MAHPLRFQMRSTKGWRKPEGGVCCARPSKWGNPFKVGDRRIVAKEMGWGLPTSSPIGPVGELFEVVVIETVEQAIEMYRAWMRTLLTTSVRAAWWEGQLIVLRGKPLGCYCGLDKACHVDVLCELANA